MPIPEERYKYVCGQLNYLNDKILESFTQFVTLLTAIAGGVIWLRPQKEWSAIWNQTKPLAIALIVVVALQAIVRVWLNLWSWWGFRQAESELTNGAVQPPLFPRSASQELTLSIVIIITLVGALILVSRIQ
jgi:hypothetical protein